jgi:hypothetical protein
LFDIDERKLYGIEGGQKQVAWAGPPIGPCSLGIR